MARDVNDESDEHTTLPKLRTSTPSSQDDFYVPKTQVISRDLKAAVVAAVDARRHVAPVSPPQRDLHFIARVLVAVGAVVFAIGLAMFLTMT